MERGFERSTDKGEGERIEGEFGSAFGIDQLDSEKLTRLTRSTDTAVLDSDVDVVFISSFGLEVDNFKLGPLLGIVNGVSLEFEVRHDIIWFLCTLDVKVKKKEGRKERERSERCVDLKEEYRLT